MPAIQKGSPEKMLNRLTILSVLLMALLLPAAYAAPAEVRVGLAEVAVEVRSDNSYHVEQDLLVEAPPAGDAGEIRERIALKPQVAFTEGGVRYARQEHIDVSSVEANGPLDLQVADGVLDIGLGPPEDAGPGAAVRYQLSYDYHVGDDGFAAADLFSFPLISSARNTVVDRVEFRISMPGPFDPAAVRFAVAGADATDLSGLRWEADGDSLAGSFAGPLAPDEGLEVRVLLPQGYFPAAGVLRTAGRLCVWTAAGLAAFTLIVFLRNRKSPRVPVPVQKEAPAGLTPADLALVADGAVGTEDVLSLLPYWAEEGSLEIRKTGEGTEPDWLFVRQCDLPLHANGYEKLMFGELFRHGDRITARALRERFATVAQDAKTRIRNRFQTAPDWLYTPGSVAAAETCALLAPTAPALTLAMAGCYETYSSEAGIALGLLGYLAGILLSWWYARMVGRGRSAVHPVSRLQEVLLALLSAVYLAAVGLAGSTFLHAYAPAVPASFLLMMLLAPRCRRRTERGSVWRAQVFGLRQFMAAAAAEKAFPGSRDPGYFSRLLPYADVLGLRPQWLALSGGKGAERGSSGASLSLADLRAALLTGSEGRRPARNGRAG